MNLSLQLCSLVIFLAILICWLLPKKLNLNGNKVYNGLIIVTGISIFLDIVAMYFAFHDNYNKTLRIWLFKAYLISTIVTSYFTFAYLVSISLKRKVVEKFAQFSIIAPVIVATLICIFPLEITVLPNGLDAYGNSIYTAYGCGLIFLVLIVIALYVSKDTLNRWHRICFILFAVVWLSISCVQFFSKQTGFMSITFSCSLLSTFIFIENPLNYINHEYGCFKSNYIESYLSNICKRKTKAFLFSLKIDNQNKATNVDKSDIVKFKKQIVKHFFKFEDAKIFINENKNVLIVCENPEKNEQYKTIIQDMIDNFYNSIDYKQYFRSELIICDDLSIFKYADEILSHLLIVENKLKLLSDNKIEFNINMEQINSIKMEEQIKQDIVDALKEDRVEAFVQPIYSVERHKIISAEALCRIRNKDGSMMLPYQFIPVSEKCGLDVPIGYRMVEKICQFLADPDIGNSFEYVDINLSIFQCEQEDMAQKIINISQKYGVLPNRLNFEITESGFADKMGNIERNIKLLTGYGFGFSLDDFGSGESNLDYLYEMPAKYLKLDMHMIWAYFENERAKKTVQAIIKISHDMGLKVVAEGVENKEQLDELSLQHVDFIQGYYFFKPMLINEYVEILKNKETSDKKEYL